MSNITQEQVDEALDTAAKENGYEEIATWGPGELAMDLIERCAPFEDARPSSIIPLIRDWQKRNGGTLVAFTWRTGRHTGSTMHVPEAVIQWTQAEYIESLEKELSQENKRANDNALETITLGRHLSIAVKALISMRGVMVAVKNLRRFGGDAEKSGNPMDAWAAGHLAMQDGKELDAAIMAASQALEQLEKEYPAEAGPEVAPEPQPVSP